MARSWVDHQSINQLYITRQQPSHAEFQQNSYRSPHERSSRHQSEGSIFDRRSRRTSAMDTTTNGTASTADAESSITMLTELQPSSNAKNDAEKVTDPAPLGRLIWVCVKLSRQPDTVSRAKTLSQFVLDLIGKEKWDEMLPGYLHAKPLKNDDEVFLLMVQESVTALMPYDPNSAEDLHSMYDAWDYKVRLQ